MVEAKRFPTPWHVEEGDAAFIVRDATGLAVGRVASGPNMTRDEARRIAERMVQSADQLVRQGETVDLPRG